MLKHNILNKKTGYLFYGLTPPKQNTEEEKIKSIAQKQIDRIKDLGIDALVLYDIQDESSRTNKPRPFPFLKTLAPDYYNENYLQKLSLPKIIYKSVAGSTKESFTKWIKEKEGKEEFCVFVGAPSKTQKISLSLIDAYKIKQEANSDIILGGVTIPERHFAKGDEHERVFDKIDKSCQFFISQCVYNVDNAKHFISDYYYAAKERDHDLAPIIFTLTPCGSVKTLEFMNWLGIDIPGWLKNELKYSNDILAKSVNICKDIAKELYEYCNHKGIPVGFNIESVAIRKAEIDASIELLKSVKAMME